MAEDFQCETRADGVAWLRLARPERGNAFDGPLIAGLTRALDALGGNANVSAVILAGEGKHFCAGADIGWMQRMAAASGEDNVADAKALARLMHVLDGLPKTTIARVQGNAYGGGLGLVACCDIVAAASDARFCLPEVRLGLIPAVISPFVVRAIGERAARRYFQTGEVITVTDAKVLGLVHEIVDNGALDVKIEEILYQLERGAPGAKVAAKALVRDVARWPIDPQVMQETAVRIADIRAGAEAKEGLAAFLDHRAPSWKKGGGAD